MLLSVMLVFVRASDAQSAQVFDYVIPNDSGVQTLSSNVILYCKDTDTVMYHKNAKKIIEPGSFVKVMVGALSLELYKDRLNEEITLDKQLLSGAQGLSIQLEPGETVTVKDLVYGLMLMGANDAAVVLSRLYSGNSEDFIALMNEKAKEVGAENTVYKNVTGLHAKGMVTTLNDTLKIIDYAAGVEDFLTVTSTSEYVVPENEIKDERKLITRTLLLSKHRDTRYKTGEVTGMNYGSTAEAGECLIATFKRDGMTYYAAINGGYVTVDTEKKLTVFEDALTLISHAEDDFMYVKVLDKKQSYGQVGVKYNSTSDTAELVPTDDVILYMPRHIDSDSDIEYRITAYEKEIAAPIAKGQVVGKLTAYYEDVKLCTVPVAVKEDVSQNSILYYMERIEEMTKTPFFIVSVVVFVGLLLLYWAAAGIIAKSKKNKRKRLR